MAPARRPPLRVPDRRGAFEEVGEGWLGVPMFFAGQSREDDERMLREAGLEIELAEIREEEERDEGTVSFHWVIARRPAWATSGGP